jgi:glycosyltransferase involved in cell wall biosynthesis
MESKEGVLMTVEAFTHTGMSRSPDDLGALMQACIQDPSDKSARSGFIRAYENLTQENQGQSPDEEAHLVYLKLKSIYDAEKWKYLGQIGRIYLRKAKPRLAFMCLSESLRQNPAQGDIFEIAERLAATLPVDESLKMTDPACAVSVIMPTYKRSESIGESIRSVMNQTLTDVELVVINDGGDDTARKIIDSFGSPRIRYYRLDRNRGLSAALNEGIRLAQGRYIAYLDDDDIYYPDHLKTLAESIAGTHYDFVYSNCWRCAGERTGSGFVEASRTLHNIRPERYSMDSLFRANYISTLNILHKRECFSGAGLFNEDLIQLMDWDMWLRFARKYRFLQINGISGEYRWHESNMTVKNHLENMFLSTIVRLHHEFDCGKIALMKGYLREGDMTKFKELYDALLDDYESRPANPAYAAELFLVSEHLAGNNRPAKMLRDYFRYDPRKCLGQLLKNRRASELLSISDLLLSKGLDRITRVWRRGGN